jgi:hypothetical protein
MSDKRYVQKQYLSTTDSLRKGFAVAVRALYDYYPFGMPMKERSTSDTTTQSVYMSQVVYSPQYTKVNNAMSGASITSLNTTASTNYNGSINYTGQSASISKVLSSLLPNVPVQMKIDLLYTNKPLYLAIQQGSAASPSVYTNLLYSTTMNSSGTYTISFTPTQSSVQLSIAYSYFNTNANTLCFTLDSVNYQQQSASVSSTQLVQVSNKINDGYRFGYNGQEKVDEIAGAGNHNTAEFWEYDTRLGRRWNRDPKPNPSISNYAAFANNPVMLVDPDGRLPIIPWLLKAGAGAAADMLAQASMDYLFNSNTTSWSQAFDNVNYYQVARSGAEGLIPWRTPGGKLGRAALSASGDVVVNAMNNPNGYTAEQAGMDFTTGFIGDLAGGEFGQILNKYGSKAVINGLMDKMGYGAEQIRKMTGGFDGESVRKWYSDKVKGIDINLAPTEANARMVVGQRNTLKQQGRDLMSDRKAAANLDITDPIRDFDYYNTKYSGDYKKIMQGGTKPNPAVNKKYGE